MSITFLVPILFLASWGFGALMKTIGKFRGWSTKLTFWLSAILYALIFIGFVFLLLITPIYSSQTVSMPFIYLGLGILSIFINLAVKWMFPDVFSKQTSRQADTTKETPLPFTKLTNDYRSTPESIKTSYGVKGYPTNPWDVPSKIFISYRRSDSADITGRIYDRLVNIFGRNIIFKDVDSIPLGLDFKEYLDKKVGECHVLLAVIGDRWLEAGGKTGIKRLDDPADFVRIELESALARNIPVIPLLVRGAQMPAEESLPPSLRKLVFRNGTPIRPDPDFHRDVDRLIRALQRYVG